MRHASTAFVAFVFLAVAVSAQPVRTFVATTGMDSNPCSLAQPCRNFASGVAAVATGGEVVALDSGGYGPVRIDKSVSLIAAPGVHAAIAPTAGDAISQNHGVNIAVIRGLFLRSHGASEGIRIDGATVHVERTHVSGFAIGLRKHWGTIMISDSVFDGNNYGVSLADTTATISRTRFQNNELGLVPYLESTVTCIECVATSNGTGFRLSTGGQYTPELTLERSVAANSRYGGVETYTDSSGVATLRVSNSTIVGNAYGVRNILAGTCVASGTCTPQLLSLGNNTVEGNGTNGAFGDVLPLK